MIAWAINTVDFHLMSSAEGSELNSFIPKSRLLLGPGYMSAALYQHCYNLLRIKST